MNYVRERDFFTTGLFNTLPCLQEIKAKNDFESVDCE